MSDREFWLAQRDALLRQVDAIERLLEMEPRTAELRRQRKLDASNRPGTIEVTPSP